MRLRTPSPPPDLAPAVAAPSRADQLAQARRATRRRDRWRQVAAVVVAAGLVAGLAWLLGYSDLLAVRDARVEGVAGPLAEQVEAAAAVPIGVPLARVDTAAVAQRAESVADVASVTVSRGWPQTLVLRVTPRVGLATMASEGEWRLVDADGVVFASLPLPADDLPILEAPEGEDGLDRRVAGVSVATVLPPDVLRSVERIEASSPGGVRLLLRDGRVVVWGTAEDAERKAEVLTVLLGTPATAYDVSVPDRPTLRPSL